MPNGRPRKTSAAAPGGRAAREPQVRFAEKLILNQWLLSLFGVKKFTELAEHLRNQALEGLDENNIHRFHHVLTAQFVNLPQLPAQFLLNYDQNIVSHTQKLNENRITHGQEPIRWKYFQYLTLLFTEIYLDHYFTNPQALLAALNVQVATYNADKALADQITPFDEQAEAWPQLNKLAFWSATGSGKTLLMHANILQYQYYLVQKGRRSELNRIILLTPNEGLSQQHLHEFHTAGIEAELFDKNKRTIFTEHWVQILDMHKLKDEMGEKTVAVDAFEGNNLVLVDEGHRGASSGEEGTWMRHRNGLCDKGFSFEYSATFGQAVKANKKLTNSYAKSILFDYSYRYFYGDGFGKDYQILNLDEGTERNHRELYLVACLLAFFQQQRLYREQAPVFRPFDIEKPLWIFVGGSVTKTLAKDDVTDIIEILLFLTRYVADSKGSIERIGRVLSQGLVTADGKNLFADRFPYLNAAGLSATQLFQETLATLFNAPGGGTLHVENLKGATGEIALRVGENAPFGVINVGDDAKLCKLCEEHRELTVTESQFAGSLFHEINKPASTINLLIGAKKFTEGWNSWRVSTMGLMNVGQSEGVQIIQLFGRGVRLKGYKQCLKRSDKAHLPDDVRIPEHIELLETLGIFGIRANYMAQFRDFLEEEGLGKDKKAVEFKLPVVKHLSSQLQLKTIRLKKTINGVNTEFGDAFRRLGPIPMLAKPDVLANDLTEHLQKNKAELDWYPKIHAMKSRGVVGGDEAASKNVAYLTERHVAFLDVDRLYFELERFKAERGWYNLNLTRDSIRQLLGHTNWYTLLIPAEEMAFTSFKNVQLWEEIAVSLLKQYTEHYYTFRKAAWEFKHLEYRDLQADDPNFLCVKEEPHGSYYRITVDEDRTDLVVQLEELKKLIEQGKLKSSWEFGGLNAASFGPHLYEPLLFLDRTGVQVSPVPLNKGEWQFVQDLKSFYDNAGGFFANRELYLLRNQSKGRGVGFFEAGNFHPDFMVWLVAGGQQQIIFVDPKGIWNLGQNDRKVRFHETIKVIEQRLADPNVRLESFIVTPTRFSDIQIHWNTSKPALLDKHILFQEDKDTYVETLLQMVTDQGK